MTFFKYNKDMYDVVYFVKESRKNEELVYSLRSIAKNFPKSRVWVIGGLPDGLSPDTYLQLPQVGTNKWQKVRGMFLQALPWLPNEFILFNDDFFLMQPYTPTTFVDGTLEDLCSKIEQKNNGRTGYTSNLRRTIDTLHRINRPTKNYELHVPMPMEKAKLELILKKFPKVHGLRSLYGNYYRVPSVEHPDIKIHDLGVSPTGKEDLLSSSDHSWTFGQMGKYLRRSFPQRSRFEPEIES